jgi:hypothetical protein
MKLYKIENKTRVPNFFWIPCVKNVNSQFEESNPWAEMRGLSFLEYPFSVLKTWHFISTSFPLTQQLNLFKKTSNFNEKKNNFGCKEYQWSRDPVAIIYN